MFDDSDGNIWGGGNSSPKDYENDVDDYFFGESDDSGKYNDN